MPASASAATSSGWVEGSSITQARAEVSRYSAIPPSESSPGKELFAQCMSLPARQARHSPQVGVGCRITVSPTATLVTAEPISCTQPAFSCPIVYGSEGPMAASHCPSMMCRSVRQTPAPPIRTTTSNGFLTTGSGTCSILGCWWYPYRRTAFTVPPRFVSGLAPLLGRCAPCDAHSPVDSQDLLGSSPGSLRSSVAALPAMLTPPSTHGPSSSISP